VGLGSVHGSVLVLGGDREAYDRRRRVRPNLAHRLSGNPSDHAPLYRMGFALDGRQVTGWGGALLNLGGHGFDMARFLTGEEPEVVSAVVSRRVQGGEVEDYALATLRTPSGILFHNEVGYTMPTWPANQTDGEQKVAGERM